MSLAFQLQGSKTLRPEPSRNHLPAPSLAAQALSEVAMGMVEFLLEEGDLGQGWQIWTRACSEQNGPAQPLISHVTMAELPPSSGPIFHLVNGRVGPKGCRPLGAQPRGPPHCERPGPGHQRQLQTQASPGPSVHALAQPPPRPTTALLGIMRVRK